MGIDPGIPITIGIICIFPSKLLFLFYEEYKQWGTENSSHNDETRAKVITSEVTKTGGETIIEIFNILIGMGKQAKTKRPVKNDYKPQPQERRQT